MRLDPGTIVVLVNMLLPQLDLNPVVSRLDVDQIVEKVDVNVVLERIDIDALVERTELGAIVASAGSSVAAEVLDSVRSAGVGLDSFVHGWADRLLRRDRSTSVKGPTLLVDEAPMEPT